MNAHKSDIILILLKYNNLHRNLLFAYIIDPYKYTGFSIREYTQVAQPKLNMFKNSR